MHDLTVDDDLISTDLVAFRIRWVRSRRNVDLAPLAVGGHKLALFGAVLEFLVDALIIDAALPLDEG